MTYYCYFLLTGICRIEQEATTLMQKIPNAVSNEIWKYVPLSFHLFHDYNTTYIIYREFPDYGIKRILMLGSVSAKKFQDIATKVTTELLATWLQVFFSY